MFSGFSPKMSSYFVIGAGDVSISPLACPSLFITRNSPLLDTGIRDKLCAAMRLLQVGICGHGVATFFSGEGSCWIGVA